MQASPLNRLPGEIRNDIYEKVLVSDKPIRVHAEFLDPSEILTFAKALKTTLLFNCKRDYPPALSTACRQIPTETLSIFFTQSTFQMNIGPESDDIRPSASAAVNLKLFNRFMDLVSARNINQLRIQVDAGTFDASVGGILQLMRDLLKGVASKKRQNVASSCVATLTIYDGLPLPDGGLRKTFSLDCWCLRQSLLDSGLTVVEEIQQTPGIKDSTLRSTKQMGELFLMWAKAARTA